MAAGRAAVPGGASDRGPPGGPRRASPPHGHLHHCHCCSPLRMEAHFSDLLHYMLGCACVKFGQKCSRFGRLGGGRRTGAVTRDAPAPGHHSNHAAWLWYAAVELRTGFWVCFHQLHRFGWLLAPLGMFDRVGRRPVAYRPRPSHTAPGAVVSACMSAPRQHSRQPSITSRKIS